MLKNRVFEKPMFEKLVTMAIIKRLALLSVLAVASNAAFASDQPEAWDYKDWSAVKMVQQGTQDTLVTCEIMSDAAATASLQASHLAADAGPPALYPTITRIAAVNAGPMAVAESIPSTWTFDAKTSITVTLTSDYIGEQNTFTVPQDQSEALLAEMAKGNTLVIDDDVFGTNTYSLSGFSAVYRKISDWCDFSLTGVLN